MAEPVAAPSRPGRGPDLFAQAAADRLRQRAPLAARLRPRTLDDIVGQRHLVAPERPAAGPHRAGPPDLGHPVGTGRERARRRWPRWWRPPRPRPSCRSRPSTPGWPTSGGAIDEARRRLGEQGRGTILFIDEVHRFNKSQQDALLPAVEEGLVVLIGATTENPFFAVNSPLLSRSTLWRLEPLGDDDIAEVVRRGLEAEERQRPTTRRVAALVSVADGDARAALGHPRGGRWPWPGTSRSPPTVVERARAGRLLHQGADAHYDQMSALIKSIRGSDPDAGLYWLARMLEGGEDARFIARRLVILASEDIGLADPWPWWWPTPRPGRWSSSGCPRPSSTWPRPSSTWPARPSRTGSPTALGRARDDVRTGPGPMSRPTCATPTTAGRAELGHGEGYRYPHDDPRGWVEQDYRPPQVAGRVYYEPSDHGAEAALGRTSAPAPARRRRIREDGEG